MNKTWDIITGCTGSSSPFPQLGKYYIDTAVESYLSYILYLVYRHMVIERQIISSFFALQKMLQSDLTVFLCCHYIIIAITISITVVVAVTYN